MMSELGNPRKATQREEKGREKNAPKFENAELASVPCPPSGDSFALACSVLHQLQRPKGGSLQRAHQRSPRLCMSLWAHAKARRHLNSMRD